MVMKGGARPQAEIGDEYPLIMHNFTILWDSTKKTQKSGFNKLSSRRGGGRTKALYFDTTAGEGQQCVKYCIVGKERGCGRRKGQSRETVYLPSLSRGNDPPARTLSIIHHNKTQLCLSIVITNNE